ncbi:cytochrome B5-like protein isoform X2 [Hibiscus syriacus]|uniref:cytochrome B5-like protein isoform X2 n=1 Tax=Hibiscus syriacus TaxID=106335 RepID=UPI001921F955|nr:cytochrome B5-like protein isoform X2 [Hibiscus syriacus]
MEIAVIALILAVLLGAVVLIPRHGKSAHKNRVKSSVDDSKASKSHSKSEVMLHDKRTDCWIIIKDKRNTQVVMQSWHIPEMIQPKGFLGHSMQLGYLT